MFPVRGPECQPRYSQGHEGRCQCQGHSCIVWQCQLTRDPRPPSSYRWCWLLYAVHIQTMYHDVPLWRNSLTIVAMVTVPSSSAASKWRSGHAVCVKLNTAGAVMTTDNPWGCLQYTYNTTADTRKSRSVLIFNLNTTHHDRMVNIVSGRWNVRLHITSDRIRHSMAERKRETFKISFRIHITASFRIVSSYPCVFVRQMWK